MGTPADSATNDTAPAFMREAGMADVGDALWAHSELLKHKVLERHVKNAEKNMVNTFKQQQETLSAASEKTSAPMVFSKPSSKDTKKISQKGLLSSLIKRPGAKPDDQDAKNPSNKKAKTGDETERSAEKGQNDRGPDAGVSALLALGAYSDSDEEEVDEKP